MNWYENEPDEVDSPLVNPKWLVDVGLSTCSTLNLTLLMPSGACHDQLIVSPDFKIKKGWFHAYPSPKSLNKILKVFCVCVFF